jgi:hypothetical protein
LLRAILLFLGCFINKNFFLFSLKPPI